MGSRLLAYCYREGTHYLLFQFLWQFNRNLLAMNQFEYDVPHVRLICIIFSIDIFDTYLNSFLRHHILFFLFLLLLFTKLNHLKLFFLEFKNGIFFFSSVTKKEHYFI